ncbi:MAG: prepilin-type N-terminal cleavage/methylation domain-containing protein [Pseudomonadota bacterium]
MTRDPEAGFTLVELLVALTLVGLMSVAIFGGLRFGTRTWEAGTQRSEELNEVVLVQDLMRRHLVQLAAVDQVRRRSEEHPIFVGDGQSVSFVAPLSAHVGLDGLYQFELALEDGEDREQNLIIRWQLYRADRVPGTTSELDGERVLLEGISEGEFSYFGASERRDEPAWRETWSEQAQLPALIALEVAFPEDDRRKWPFFRVAPQRVPALVRP